MLEVVDNMSSYQEFCCNVDPLPNAALALFISADTFDHLSRAFNSFS